MSDKSVHVEPVEKYPALRMVWEHRVHSPDVKPAFETIVSELDAARRPVYVIVDLTRDPNFPLAETTMHAVPAYRHFRLAAWLVVGTNKFAEYISKFLNTATGRSNVLWFDTEAEALAYVDKQPPPVIEAE